MRIRSWCESGGAWSNRSYSELPVGGTGGPESGGETGRSTWMFLADNPWRWLLREDFRRPAAVTGPRDLAPLIREASI